MKILQIWYFTKFIFNRLVLHSLNTKWRAHPLEIIFVCAQRGTGLHEIKSCSTKHNLITGGSGGTFYVFNPYTWSACPLIGPISVQCVPILERTVQNTSVYSRRGDCSTLNWNGMAWSGATKRTRRIPWAGQFPFQQQKLDCHDGDVSSLLNERSWFGRGGFHAESWTEARKWSRALVT